MILENRIMELASTLKHKEELQKTMIKSRGELADLLEKTEEVDKQEEINLAIQELDQSIIKADLIEQEMRDKLKYATGSDILYQTAKAMVLFI